MRWESFDTLILPGEDREAVFKSIRTSLYCAICKAKRVPAMSANTELSYDPDRGTYSACNVAILLECGHILVDDCLPASKLNGKCFRNEEKWRQKVVSQRDVAMRI